MKNNILLILLILYIFIFSTESVRAQQCGPGCPVCSGKAVGDLLPPATILGSGLYIPKGEDETAVLNLRYGLFSWMDAGIGYTREAGKYIWSVRLQPVSQDPGGWRPALIVGTGSVQVGESDQSAFIQLAKTLEIIEGRLAVSLAGGYATDFPDLEKNWGLGTFSMTIYDRVSPFYLYDGINSHAGLSFFATDWITLSGYMLEMEAPALSVNLQWAFGGREEE